MTRKHRQGAVCPAKLPLLQRKPAMVRSCTAILLALPLSIGLAQTMEPAVPEQLGVDRVSGILGRPVYDLLGATAGRIVDVLVDETGQTRAAVVDFGGFMGLGQRRVAVAWRALRFRTPDGRVTVVLSAEQIGAAAEYRPGTPVTIMAPP